MSGFSSLPDLTADKKGEIMLLESQRKALEVEAQAITTELNAPGPGGEPPVGVKGPLVDSNGFPLAAYDLFSVREKRHRLNCIQTDHKALMAKLENSLHALHGLYAANGHKQDEAGPSVSSPSDTKPNHATPVIPTSTKTQTTDTNAVAGRNHEVLEETWMKPLALVNRVFEGSPAAAAGLVVGDLLLRFGSVDVSNPKGMDGIIDFVRDNNGREVSVKVLRHGAQAGQSSTKELKLVPQTWGGRGLIGVHLLKPP